MSMRADLSAPSKLKTGLLKRGANACIGKLLTKGNFEFGIECNSLEALDNIFENHDVIDIVPINEDLVEAIVRKKKRRQDPKFSVGLGSSIYSNARIYFSNAIEELKRKSFLMHRWC